MAKLEAGVEAALTTAHAVIREGIHEDRRFRQEALDKIEGALGYDPSKPESWKCLEGCNIAHDSDEPGASIWGVEIVRVGDGAWMATVRGASEDEAEARAAIVVSAVNAALAEPG